MISRIFPLLFLVIFQAQLGLLLARYVVPHRTLLQTAANTSSSCPLDFGILRRLAKEVKRPKIDPTAECQYIRQGLRLVESDYLRRTGFFLPPLEAAESCWNAYQSLFNSFERNFDIRSTCGFQTSWISQGCMGITSRQEFESNVTQATLKDVVSACNQSLENGSPCAACTTTLSTLQASYLTGPSVGNVSECIAYPLIYAAAFVNRFGPTDKGTTKCLFSLDFTQHKSGKKKTVIVAVGIVCGVVLVLGLLGFWILWRKRKQNLSRIRWKSHAHTNSSIGPSALDSISANTNLIKFTIEEIKMATNNFSWQNIIGRGGYGNVYKGILPDGSEVALKRFKNCSAAGDASFTHEVEVIASIRHVNLVALRGYCVATTSFEGHQRIIVCDLIKNGSLHDHLYGNPDQTKLSWPVRQRIALGTARGLAYLHSGAQPGIIHRDIKASNILLDEDFEPKVADFGLAKFTPEGVTHLSTRVAGTMGYVAPEYALYGQLTERSDVYSFGVLLLELLSGRKAIMAAVNDNGDQQQPPTLVTDWAWALVKKGRTLDVIEENMPNRGSPEVMEKFILIAVLCSHPQMHARPTMEQVVKMLDTDEIAVPLIPERPIPLTAEIHDIHKSVSTSSGGSGHLSSASGYQPYTFEKDYENHSLDR